MSETRIAAIFRVSLMAALPRQAHYHKKPAGGADFSIENDSVEARQRGTDCRMTAMGGKRSFATKARRTFCPYVLHRLPGRAGCLRPAAPCRNTVCEPIG